MNLFLRQIGALGWNRILIFFLILWLIILLFTALPIFTTQHIVQGDTKTAERLSRALSELEALRKQNAELQELFKDITLGLVYLHFMIK